MKPSHGKRTREAIGGTLQKVLKVLHQIKGIPQNEMLYEINQVLGEGESELNKGQLSRWIAGETIPETAQAIEVLPVVLGRWGNLLMPDDFEETYDYALCRLLMYYLEHKEEGIDLAAKLGLLSDQMIKKMKAD